ncbi:hypothetical protein V1291_005305 [Nitrobacteraceae bacterium AZCC 1564]
MNLTGGRTTLILNICALVVAAVVILEGASVIYRIYGSFALSDWFIALVPLTTMFVVRNKLFSAVFPFFYVALAIQMGFQASSVYSGAYKFAGEKYPFGFLTLFSMVSLVCLAIYLVDFIVRVCESIYGRLKG